MRLENEFIILNATKTYHNRYSIFMFCHPITLNDFGSLYRKNMNSRHFAVGSNIFSMNNANIYIEISLY